MASVKPYKPKPGWWRAQVVRKGIHRTRIFPSKGAADAWARRNEEAILSGEIEPPNLKLSDLFTRYAKEVSPQKKGAKWEKVRLDLLGRDRIAQVRLRDLSAAHLSDWQRRRLLEVSSASCRRERNLLNNGLEIARKEWGWIKRNPFEGVRRPKDTQPRDRLATDEEIAKVRGKASEALNRAITVAVETGMRASEIAGIGQNDLDGMVAVLRETKNGTRRRVVLSQAAFDSLPVGITAGSISELWARACRDAEVKGLTFHDLRRYAITKLAGKLDPFQLAKMVGHKDLRMTLNVYYSANEEEIAKLLNAPPPPAPDAS